jgi:hypothetical protein
MVPTRVATSYVVRTRVVQSYSKEVQFLPTCCEQRVTYVVIGISDLELESTFLEHLFHPRHQRRSPRTAAARAGVTSKFLRIAYMAYILEVTKWL